MSFMRPSEADTPEFWLKKQAAQNSPPEAPAPTHRGQLPPPGTVPVLPPKPAEPNLFDKAKTAAADPLGTLFQYLRMFEAPRRIVVDPVVGASALPLMGALEGVDTATGGLYDRIMSGVWGAADAVPGGSAVLGALPGLSLGTQIARAASSSSARRDALSGRRTDGSATTNPLEYFQNLRDTIVGPEGSVSRMTADFATDPLTYTGAGLATKGANLLQLPAKAAAGSKGAQLAMKALPAVEAVDQALEFAQSAPLHGIIAGTKLAGKGVSKVIPNAFKESAGSQVNAAMLAGRDVIRTLRAGGDSLETASHTLAQDAMNTVRTAFNDAPDPAQFVAGLRDPELVRLFQSRDGYASPLVQDEAMRRGIAIPSANGAELRPSVDLHAQLDDALTNLQVPADFRTAQHNVLDLLTQALVRDNPGVYPNADAAMRRISIQVAPNGSRAGVRGAIETGPDGGVRIILTPQADVTTMAHELGHFLVRELHPDTVTRMQVDLNTSFFVNEEAGAEAIENLLRSRLPDPVYQGYADTTYLRNTPEARLSNTRRDAQTGQFQVAPDTGTWRAMTQQRTFGPSPRELPRETPAQRKRFDEQDRLRDEAFARVEAEDALQLRRSDAALARVEAEDALQDRLSNEALARIEAEDRLDAIDAVRDRAEATVAEEARLAEEERLRPTPMEAWTQRVEASSPTPALVARYSEKMAQLRQTPTEILEFFGNNPKTPKYSEAELTEAYHLLQQHPWATVRGADGQAMRRVLGVLEKRILGNRDGLTPGTAPYIQALADLRGELPATSLAPAPVASPVRDRIPADPAPTPPVPAPSRIPALDPTNPPLPEQGLSVPRAEFTPRGTGASFAELDTALQRAYRFVDAHYRRYGSTPPPDKLVRRAQDALPGFTRDGATQAIDAFLDDLDGKAPGTSAAARADLDWERATPISHETAPSARQTAPTATNWSDRSAGPPVRSMPDRQAPASDRFITRLDETGRQALDEILEENALRSERLTTEGIAERYGVSLETAGEIHSAVSVEEAGRRLVYTHRENPASSLGIVKDGSLTPIGQRLAKAREALPENLYPRGLDAMADAIKNATGYRQDVSRNLARALMYEWRTGKRLVDDAGQPLTRTSTVDAGLVRGAPVSGIAPLSSESVAGVISRIGDETRATPQAIQETQDAFAQFQRIHPDAYDAAALWYGDLGLRRHVEAALKASTPQARREAMLQMVRQLNDAHAAVSIENPAFGALRLAVGASEQPTRRLAAAPGRSNYGSRYSDEQAQLAQKIINSPEYQRLNAAYRDAYREAVDVFTAQGKQLDELTTLSDVLTARNDADSLGDVNGATKLDTLLSVLQVRNRKGDIITPLDNTVRDLFDDEVAASWSRHVAKELGWKPKGPPGPVREVLGLAMRAWTEQARLTPMSVAQDYVDLVVKNSITGYNPVIGKNPWDQARRMGIAVPIEINDSFKAAALHPQAQPAGLGMTPVDQPSALGKVIPALDPVVKFRQSLMRWSDSTARGWVWWGNVQRVHMDSFPALKQEVTRQLDAADAQRLVDWLDSRGPMTPPDEIAQRVFLETGNSDAASVIGAYWTRVGHIASAQGVREANRVHYNFAKTYNIEEMLKLRSWMPFYVWGTRNLPFYTQTAASNPWMLVLLREYSQLSEEQRKRTGLISRTRGMVEAPEMLWNLLGPGRLYVNPFVIFSGADQLRARSLDRDESGLSHILELAGMTGVRLPPWVDLPLSLTGALGEREPQNVLRHTGLVSAGLSAATGQPVDLEGWWKSGFRSATGQPQPRTDSPITDYQISKRIAELSLRETGQVNHPTYVAAMADPTSEIYRRASGEVYADRFKQQLYRFVSPVPVTTVSDEEAAIAARRTAVDQVLSGLQPAEQKVARSSLFASNDLSTGFSRATSDPRLAEINAGLTELGRVERGFGSAAQRNNITQRYPLASRYLSWRQAQPVGSPSSPSDFLKTLQN